ncbi:MAG: hypothetical protein ACOCP8_04720 [archaeon]
MHIHLKSKDGTEEFFEAKNIKIKKQEEDKNTVWIYRENNEKNYTIKKGKPKIQDKEFIFYSLEDVIILEIIGEKIIIENGEIK